MTTSGTVLIPADHFVKRVAREYSDHRVALGREFVQNSVDAGATRIDFITGQNALVCRDNGCGIQPERMVDALLTLGGSVKDSPHAVGGMGLAKEVLLFAHESFQIRTLGTIVEGRVLAYTMRPAAEHFAGTEVSIVFHRDFGYERECFIGKMREYLATCQLAARVTIDGEPVATDLRARAIDLPFPHGRVLTRRLPKGETTNYIHVRVNGVTMFSQYVTAIDKQVVVELDGDTRSMLTSNRDGLRYQPYGNDLAKVVAAVTVDPRSFDRKKAERQLFPGTMAKCFSQVLLEIRRTASVPVQPAIVSFFQDAVQARVGQGVAYAAAVRDVMANTAATEVEREGLRQIGEAVLERIESKNFATDFVVNLEGTELRAVPRNMRPATMSRKHRQLAQLWKRLLDHVIDSNGLALPYRVGFTLDPEKEACFVRPEGDSSAPADILVRPDAFLNIASRRERVHALLVTACHEVAHASESGHNEWFVTTQHRLLVRALAKLPPLAVLLRQARHVTL